MGGPLLHVYLPHVLFFFFFFWIFLSSLPGASAVYLPWELSTPPLSSWPLGYRELVKKALCGRWKARLSREPWTSWFLQRGQSPGFRVVGIILYLYWKPIVFLRHVTFSKWWRRNRPYRKVQSLVSHLRQSIPLLGLGRKRAQVPAKKSWNLFSLWSDDLFQATWLTWTLFAELIQDSVVVDV